MKLILAYLILCTALSAQVFNIAGGSGVFGNYPSTVAVPSGKTAIVDFTIIGDSSYLELSAGGGLLRLPSAAGLQRITVQSGTIIRAYGVGAGSHVFAQVTMQEPSDVPGFLPSNTVVIPSDANGNIEIILESSVDLVTWTAALPGVYGGTDDKRFFRVRAVSH